jgi:hypothetical protein
MCQFPGCKTQPVFNLSGEKKAKYCAKHKTEDMIDIYNKTCQFPDCKTRPNYNLEGEKKAKYCTKHKTDDMIDITHKTCEFPDCKTKPVFNLPGEKIRKFCAKHKTDDMINGISKTCIFLDCEKRPNFNLEGEKKAKYCAKHKTDDMIDIYNKICEFPDCKTQPSYNLPGEKIRKFCTKHKTDDMIDITHKICEFPDCKTQPVYNLEGEKKAKFCVKHKTDDMIDVKHKKCKTYLCDKRFDKKYEGYCLFCFINTFPDKPVARNYKTKEKFVSDYILENFSSLKIKKDKIVEGGCSKRRPDVLIDLGHRIIIVEIDENQHTDYDCSCENKRIMELYQDLDYRSIVFIRFNPDDYIDEKGDKVTSCWNTNNKGIFQVSKNKQKEWNSRLDSLKNQINYWIENESDKAIETIHLYYDLN